MVQSYWEEGVRDGFSVFVSDAERKGTGDMSYCNGMMWGAILALWVCLTGGQSSVSAAETSGPTACIEVKTDGVTVIDGQQLAQFAPDLYKADPRTLELANDGVPVPIYIFGEEDGKFDPQDILLFYGGYPRGETTTRRIQNDTNFYFLRSGVKSPLRYVSETPPVPKPGTKTEGVFWYRYTDHIEHDFTFQKFYTDKGEKTDYYFWDRLMPMPDDEMTSVTFTPHAFEDIPSSFEKTFDLKIKFYGVSDADVDPQHEISVLVNGETVGVARWDGIREYTLDLKGLPTFLLGDGSKDPRIEFRFPDKRIDDGTVDLIMLDWVEVTYWRCLKSTNGKILEFNTSEQTLPNYYVLISGLQSKPEDAFVLDHTKGLIFRPAAKSVDEGTNFIFFPPAGEVRNYSILDRHYVHAPERIRMVAEDPAFQVGRQADMIVVTHGDFREEVEELAEYHRKQGLSVAVVDVQDVFDHYNNGFMEDVAIRDFLQFAWEKYAAPKPRYVLLVGDATWDYRHIKFPNDRNLIPIHWYSSMRWRWGGYPSENYYVAVDAKKPNFPTMAIGRIPASKKGDVRGVLEKIESNDALRGRNPKWAKRAILLTSVEKQFQNYIDDFEKNDAKGYDVEKFFPTSKDAAESTRRLVDGIDKGCSILYYIGHGGAFVWRVGPTDYEKQHDLFTIDNVQRLKNKNRYPVVLATSCYSASFDNERSIGETFLMEPEKGACAVVATGWKSMAHNDHFFHGFMMRGIELKENDRIGDAFVWAKKQVLDAKKTSSPEICESMILLGDPAMLIYRPQAVEENANEKTAR
jgi:hypothetical protein